MHKFSKQPEQANTNKKTNATYCSTNGPGYGSDF